MPLKIFFKAAVMTGLETGPVKHCTKPFLSPMFKNSLGKRKNYRNNEMKKELCCKKLGL